MRIDLAASESIFDGSSTDSLRVVGDRGTAYITLSTAAPDEVQARFGVGVTPLGAHLALTGLAAPATLQLRHEARTLEVRCIEGLIAIGGVVLAPVAQSAHVPAMMSAWHLVEDGQQTMTIGAGAEAVAVRWTTQRLEALGELSGRVTSSGPSLSPVRRV